MKRAVLCFLVLAGALLLVPCSFAQEAVQRELDALANKWVNALLSEDLAAWADCYWPDAVSVHYNPAGDSKLLEGSAAIRNEQAGWFANVDYAAMGLVYPEPARFLPGSGDMPVYIFNVKQFKFLDIFYFQKRSGRYKILKHILVQDPQG